MKWAAILVLLGLLVVYAGIAAVGLTMSAFCFDAGTQPEAWNCFGGINLVTVLPSLICLVRRVRPAAAAPLQAGNCRCSAAGTAGSRRFPGRVCCQRHLYAHPLGNWHARPPIRPTDAHRPRSACARFRLRPSVRDACLRPRVFGSPPGVDLLDQLRHPQPAALSAAGAARPRRTGAAAAAGDLCAGPLVGDQPAAHLPPERRSTAPVDRTGSRRRALGQPALAARACGALGDCSSSTCCCLRTTSTRPSWSRFTAPTQSSTATTSWRATACPSWPNTWAPHPCSSWPVALACCLGSPPSCSWCRQCSPAARELDAGHASRRDAWQCSAWRRR